MGKDGWFNCNIPKSESLIENNLEEWSHYFKVKLKFHCRSSYMKKLILITVRSDNYKSLLFATIVTRYSLMEIPFSASTLRGKPSLRYA